MNGKLLETLVTLRTVVGFLGEREQYGWWQSAFFAPGSQVFLLPVFSRTPLLAQVNGATQAAALIHDERIGVGNVYHLFRLPEEMEQRLQHVLQAPEIGAHIPDVVANAEAALDYLRQQAVPLPAHSPGPVLVGNRRELLEVRPWQQVAAHYLNAFGQGQTYPYFSGG